MADFIAGNTQKREVAGIESSLGIQPYQYFSPLYITNAIVTPLRYFFNQQAPAKFYYSLDDREQSTLEIGSVNDMFKQVLGVKPRILVDRGGFQIDKTGLTDNMSFSTPLSHATPVKRSTSLVMIRGSAEITIEASTEGTVELLTDIVQHFIIWTRPQICEFLGMKEFGLPMQVSPVQLTNEDREKFAVRISVPYLKEEENLIQENGFKIKDILYKQTRA